MIINEEFYKYIQENADVESHRLRLSLSKKILSFDGGFAVTQIECRRKYKSKFKNFLENPEFLFPDSTSAEQASRLSIAKYHASLFPTDQDILDITAGLGIDSLTFAEKAASVLSIELNPLKAEILKHNSKVLNLKNLKVENSDSNEYLNSVDARFDIIFADPSRRDSNNRRLYNLADCSPDVLKLQEKLQEAAPKIFIKASPLLDITQTCKDFKNIKAIRAVGVDGECKEVLIEIEREYNTSSGILYEAVNLDKEGNLIYVFSSSSKESSDIKFCNIEDIRIGSFLLEPSAMVMKLAPWGDICLKYKAKKFDKSSNLFVTDEYPANFPGRVTVIKKCLTKKDRKSLEGFPASVVSRNYPVTADEIRKKFKLQEGNLNFIYATRVNGKPMMYLSEAITN